MPMTAIRSCLPAVGPLILHLINISTLPTLTFPDPWKVAIVTPIHKSGDPTKPGNFQPISILPPLSKILENVLCSQIASCLITNHILSPSQYAYRPSHSTEDAILDIVEWAARKVDVGDVTPVDLAASDSGPGGAGRPLVESGGDDGDGGGGQRPSVVGGCRRVPPSLARGPVKRTDAVPRLLAAAMSAVVATGGRP